MEIRTRLSCFRRIALALLLVEWGASLAAEAQSVTNTRTGASYGSLGAAIADAVPNDALEVSGVVQESVIVDRSLHLVGLPGATIRSGAPNILELAASVDLIVEGFHLDGTGDTRGILAARGGNRLLVRTTTFTTGTTDLNQNGGGIQVLEPRWVALDDVLFDGSDEVWARQGGALFVQATGRRPPPVILHDVQFDRIQASGQGGAVWTSGVALRCDGCTFDGTGGSFGGGIYAAFGTLEVERSLFCGSYATLGGAIFSSAVADVRNTSIVESSSVVNGSALYANGGEWSIVNNHFLGNVGPVAVYIPVLATPVAVTNNLFLDNLGTGILINNSDLGSTYSPPVTYNSFWGNDAAASFPLDATNVVDERDPLLLQWSPDGDCANDRLWPTPLLSPLIDEGDPAIADPDGTRSDIGAFGGESADPDFFTDHDGDGFAFLNDCDDSNPAFYPGAFEVCDGLDNDCDGQVDADPIDLDIFHEDCDLDGQGSPIVSAVQCFEPAEPPACGGVWLSQNQHGSLANSDCDDQDPNTHVGAPETCAAGDRNCDGDDDLDAIDSLAYFEDGDLDGVGSEPVLSCSAVPVPGLSLLGGDCDDGDPLFYPGAPDPCGDGLDQDCSGRDDDGDDVSCDCGMGQQRLNADDYGEQDWFGSSVALSGDNLVVGAPEDDIDGTLDQGSAYVFARIGASWVQQQKLVADTGSRSGFGSSVAISGDTLVVGTPLADVDHEDQGAAYVFEQIGSTWMETQRLTAGDAAASDVFGGSVAVSGSTIVVGAGHRDIDGRSDQGSAYVFVLVGDTWMQQQKLWDIDGDASDYFGGSVAIDGDTVVVGAKLDDIGYSGNQGSVHVFTRSDDLWTRQQKLTGNDRSGSSFGGSVAISGDTLVVGLWSWPALAYVFVRDGGSWTEQQELTSDGVSSTLYGTSVAISGDAITVGTKTDTIDGSDSQGSAFLFVRNGNIWIQQRKLVANNGAPNDRLGSSVAIDQGTIVAGAPWDDGAGQRDRGSVRVFRERTSDDGECRRCPRIRVEPRRLPDATLGGSYDETVIAAGGVAPYDYSLTSRALPPGLTLAPATGRISGIPTEAGRFRFQVTATDADLCTGKRRYRIDVQDPCPTIRLRPRRLADGREGDPYHRRLHAHGGAAPYHFSAGGTEPAGLTLSPDGILSGTPTASGTFDVEIRATDANGCEGSRVYTLTIEGGNEPPTADGGPDQAVPVGATVMLDGSGSSDPDGDPLTYSWSIDSAPAGSAAALSDPTAVQTSFVADLPGAYRIELVVNDGFVDSDSDNDFVYVSTVNTPPVADAGPDQVAFAGDTVTLDGSASSDADGDPLTFLWRFSSAPAGSAAVLSDPTAVRPGFVVDATGSYDVELVVNDGQADSAPDVVTIDVPNRPPLADAGADQTVTAGVTVRLDGSGSSDPDGHPLSYSWTLTTPPGSSAVLSDHAAASPTFVADLPGIFTAELVVSDGELASPPDAAEITAVAPVVTLVATDADASETGPDPGSFTLSRTGDTGFALTVSYAIDRAVGSAENGVDYALIAETLTFPLGEAEAVLPIVPIDDAEVEGDENIVLTLLDGAAYDLGADMSGTVVIADDDLPTVILTANDPDASEEGPTAGSFLLHRNGPVTDPLTVFYDIDAAGAENGIDYQTIATSATIAAGDSSVTIPILPIDDAEIEGREDVVLRLAPGAGYVVGSPDAALVRIADNDFPVVTIVATADAAEAGPVPGTFTVSRIGPAAEALEVFYSIAGSAGNGVDYGTIATSVTIPPGAAAAEVVITPIDDAEVEGAETAVLTLADDPAYVVGAPGMASVIIADDDLPVATLVAADPVASEAGPTTGSFEFSRTGPTADALQLIVSRGGTAVSGPGGDYAEVLGAGFVFTIPAGQSSANLTITPLADNRVEASDETVELTVQPSLEYVVGSPSAATVTIVDDPPVVDLTATDPEASEAGPDPGEIRFTRSGGDLASALTAQFAIGGTATNNLDYDSIGGSVVIPAGQSSAAVTVTPRPDSLVEAPETVVLTLEGSASYLPGPSATAAVTIADDPAVVDVVATVPVASEAGPVSGELTFTRSGGDLGAALQVLVSRVGGTASNGLDYASIGGSSFFVTIAAGSASATVSIDPVDDALVEGPETVVLTISPRAAYLIGAQGTATVTIEDDD